MGAISYVFLIMTQATSVFMGLPHFQKCTKTDFFCFESAADVLIPVIASGIPEIGVEPLDVMHIDHVKIDLAGLKLTVDDVEVKGLKKSIITRIHVNWATKQMQVAWDCDIIFKGHYKASGKLLVLPISGDGIMTLNLKKLHINMLIQFDKSKNAEGKDFLDLKNHSYDFEVKENVNFNLTNLFNGNKDLSIPMLRFMNENWKIISQEFGNPMLKKPTKKVFDAIKAYLRSQPLENIMEL